MRFVIGDIHGRIGALKEVLSLSNFNYAKDKLIVLGDVVDGGYNTYQVIEELLKIKNLIYIIGNHDEWFMNHISSGWAEEIWIQQGGANTLRSYGASVKEAQQCADLSLIDTNKLNIPVTHQEFFNKGIYYYEVDKMLFVHGGFIPNKPMNEQEKHILVWDRDLINIAKYDPIPNYETIFVGHTSTTSHFRDTPLKLNNLWMMDCGAGWQGRLAIMNIDTEEHWESKIQSQASR